MRTTMVKTKNVRAADSAIDLLHKPVLGRYGMMLAYGPPGTGKTFYFQKLAIGEDYVYIRCKFIDTPRNLLMNIVEELGETPSGHTGKLYRTAVEQLIQRPRTLILDEIDYIVKKRFVEVIRDLNDMANTPIIMVGMERADKRLKGVPHLHDRIRTVVRFQTFSPAEIESLGRELCEARIDKTAADYIHKTAEGKFRLTIDLFDLAERIQKRNNYKVITAEHLQEAWSKEQKIRKAA